MKKKKIYILAAALIFSILFYIWRAAVLEVSAVRQTDWQITLEKLPVEHDGLVIAVIGDLHIRRACFENGQFDRVTEILQQRKPDLVLLLGDYISVKNPDSLLEVDNMSRVVSKWHGQYGTLAVGGNHDVHRERSGKWRYVSEALKRAGITVLDGNGVSLDIRGKAFQAAGYGDRLDAWSRMREGTEKFDRRLPVYGLVHNPEYIYSIRNPFDMIFSAHTHRGQLRMPVFGERYLLLRFRAGWRGSGVREHLGCVQFTTSGIGVSAWPLRLHNLPEVAFLTLRCPR